MNWGKKIALVYIAFVAMILSFVFKAASQDFSLVRPDYYAAETEYVAQRAAELRAASEEAGVDVHYYARVNQLLVQFPAKVNGTIHLYRPSDAKMDQRFPLMTDEIGLQEFSLHHLAKGRWQVVLQWEQDGKAYYHRQDLFVE